MDSFEELLSEVKQYLMDANSQNWLFGAGVSRNSNIPLMGPLTLRVRAIVEQSEKVKSQAVVESLVSELKEDSHIEHYLSHLGDLIAMAGRTKAGAVTIVDQTFNVDEMLDAYKLLINAIGETIRYGYQKTEDGEIVGTKKEPIVDIVPHLRFVRALMRNKANLERRSTISFFTTNYDTLIEDSLALNRIRVVDGFSGGAVGFWNPEEEFGKSLDTGLSCSLFKLHGSVDWHSDEDFGLVRARYGTKYMSDSSNIMIYPRATKYVETQKDPFAPMFSGLRNSLNSPRQNVLVICGYSFGDEHINSEIQAAMTKNGNKTTILAFAEESPGDDLVFNPTLDSWLTDTRIASRVFVCGKGGIYYGSPVPKSPEPKTELEWWTFQGLSQFLETGEL